jgi:acetoacetate decarboxylase
MSGSSRKRGCGEPASRCLIREVVEFRPRSVELGSAELIFRPSDHDPWAEVEIVRILGAVYTAGDNAMLPGSVVAEVDPMSVAPYAFMKVDEFGFA